MLILIYSVFKLYSSGYLLNEYYRAPYWDYGWEKVADVIKNELDPNLPIVVDNARNEPYSQLVVFLQADPVKYQLENFEVNNSEYYTYMGRNKDKRFGRVITRGINWAKDKKIDQYLIGDSLAISLDQLNDGSLTLIRRINYPDGSLAYLIVRTNPN